MKYLSYGFALSLFIPALAFADVQPATTATVSATADTTAAPVKKHESAKVDSHIYDIKADPSKDLAQAIADAKKGNKHILVEVGGDWCIWCRRLEGIFVSHPELTVLRDKNFVLVHVNFSDENENKAFLAQFPKVAGYPHIFVLDQDGKLLHSEDTSELEDGKSYSIARLTAFLEKWKAA